MRFFYNIEQVYTKSYIQLWNLCMQSNLSNGGIEVETYVLDEDQKLESIFCQKWRRNRVLMMTDILINQITYQNQRY